MAKEKKATETPLMKQHGEIKARYPDAVLLFRVGDFYETFGGDAIIAARVLGITLTKRANGSASHIELAGFPHHSLDTYLHKLVKAGYRVAICDQLEDPKQAKGIVKRGVTELVTPGVALNDKLLDNKSNNFLAALHLDEKESGICFLDISTGECWVAQGNNEYMDKLIQSFQPAEIVLSKSQQKHFKEQFDNKYYLFCLEEWIFQHHYGYEQLIRHFDTTTLKGLGLEDWESATIAAGAALHYLKDTEHPHLKHLTQIKRITSNDFLWMDRFTIRNLEILQSPSENGLTLLQALDNTITSMGARLLKRWLIFPLTNIPAINERLDAVAALLDHPETCQQIQTHLKQIADIERLVAKLTLKKIAPRELIQLGQSLDYVQKIAQTLSENITALQFLRQQFSDCTAQIALINNTLNEDAPIQRNTGTVIKPGLNPDLDQLKQMQHNGKAYLQEMQLRETERTGISSLKIGFNNVFGYYLEVTNAHKDKAPESWIRKQTLTNAERYITPELKEYEDKILGAEEKIVQIELEMYDQLLEQLIPHIAEMQNNAQVIAQIDCLQSYAYTAQKMQYCRPAINDSYTLAIQAGRHPVIEQRLPIGESYVPNDIFLDREEQQIIILTGPNMSGKSAVLRQTALITLMAHAGSFVPATKADIGLTDKIFTRVGASDNLSEGESTFMVEMVETASIINNISSRSLLILDEIGRGTSTYDGISIAWSIVEHLQSNKAAPKTLFATHYHELNELENKLERVKNFHITHKETNNKVIFLRKMVPGGSRHSFGIQVAKMAGMPVSLTNRASEILEQLETVHQNDSTQEKVKKIATTQFQLNIFDGLSEDLKDIRDRLFATDINTLTPVEALMKLNELKEIVKHYNV